MSRPNITQAQLDTFHDVLSALMEWARGCGATDYLDQLLDVDCETPADIFELE